MISHVDGDHIEGAVKLLNQPDLQVRFRDIWFNGWPQLSGRLTGRREAASYLLDARSILQGQYLPIVMEEHRKDGTGVSGGRAVLVPDLGHFPASASPAGWSSHF